MSGYSIIGAGPAGAVAAAVLARKGYSVRVYEALPKPGLKPCGRGIPALGDLPVEVPRDAVVREVDGAVLYVNGKHAFTLEGDLRGVIVDKTRMLEAIIVESGAEPVYGAVYKPGRRVVRVGGRYHEVRGEGLFAAGHGFYPGEKINAVQYRLRGRQFEGLDKLLIYFDTELLGYYWIFPAPGDQADVGVGGFASVEELWKRLDKFVATNEMTRDSSIVRKEGARIAVGGVVLGEVDGLPVVGEAAGYVLPLTGEGIRPSMISGGVAAKALADGVDPLGELKNAEITSSITLQRRILEKVKDLSPEKREELLLSLPREAHVLVALGKMRKADLVKVLFRKPKLLQFLLSP